MLIFVIRENETFISMIREPLFFPSVNRASYPSLYVPHLNMGLLSSNIVVNIVRQSCRRFSLATQRQTIRMNLVKMKFDANTSFRRCHGLLKVFRWEVIWIQYFHWPARYFVFTCCSANASNKKETTKKRKNIDPCACTR